MKTKRILNKAYKEANVPVWFVEYEDSEGKGQVNVYGETSKEATKNAHDIIRIANGDKPYKIINVSCV